MIDFELLYKLMDHLDGCIDCLNVKTCPCKREGELNIILLPEKNGMVTQDNWERVVKIREKEIRLYNYMLDIGGNAQPNITR